MKLRRVRRAAVVLPMLAAAVLAQCGREQRSINVYGDLTVERAAAAATLTHVEGRLDEAMISAAEFERAWSVITRQARPYGGLAVSLHGAAEIEPGVALLTGLVLVLPTPLRPGTAYPVGSALPVPATDMPMYWSEWGGRELRSATAAEIGLRVFDYHMVGMRVERNFVAAQASGTVEVVRGGRDWLDLQIDVTAVDAAGTTLRVHGLVQVHAERYTPPIT